MRIKVILFISIFDKYSRFPGQTVYFLADVAFHESSEFGKIPATC